MLGGATWYLMNNQQGTGAKKELSDFSIKDTAAVNQIFIADKQNHTLLLNRQNDNSWTINKKYKARQDMVNLLLETMHLVRVKSPVPKTMHNNVVRKLAGNSFKVEFYTDNLEDPFKVVYVGGPNKDHTGTFMLLENSSLPFVTHIEGHYGFLSTRFSTDEIVWRDNYLWQFPGKKLTEIKEVKVKNHQNPEKGFTITKNGEKNFEVNNGNGVNVDAPIGKVVNYLKGFEQVAFEGFEQTKSAEYLDSLTGALPPLFTLSVADEAGNNTEITSWKKPVKEGSIDLVTGDTIYFDSERIYLKLPTNEIVIGQYLIFDPLTPNVEIFEK